MKRPLGCLSGVGIIAVLVALLAVVLLVIATGGVLFSPGDLNAQGDGMTFGGVKSHAETGGNCAVCHAPPWSSEGMADRCAACHTAMRDSQSHLAQFHGILWSGGAEQPCRSCHPEHRGSQASLTEVKVNDFPHERTGFSLAAHRSGSGGEALECADCHADGVTAFAVATCDTCHTEVDAAYMAAHRQDFGQQCLNCHDGADRFSDFDHGDVGFALEGAHAQISCGGCHVAASHEDYARAPTNCVECHAEDDAHRGALGTDCRACHTPQRWEGANFDHTQTSFPLTGGHLSADCAGCHADERYADTPVECVACHREDDAHDEGLGQACAQCHTPDDWQDAKFDHAATTFPLEGSHSEAACQECHVAGRLKGTPAQCVECHAEDDAHGGRFGADCAQCHTPDDWEDATFDHATTAFPLTGAHQQVRCEQCHRDGRFSGMSTDCASCHEDPAYHRGLFAQGCDACHATAGWQPARLDLTHSFPLSHGTPAVSSCRTCHADTLFGYTCYGCHEHDPAEMQEEHADEGIADIGDCAGCHPNGQKDEAEGAED
ncbi:MAG: hypothetical protein MUC34_14375 [Anaerolineae bacterium]|nr:hypothetical protein [Anaerolineae bacterium]